MGTSGGYRRRAGWRAVLDPAMWVRTVLVGATGVVSMAVMACGIALVPQARGPPARYAGARRRRWAHHRQGGGPGARDDRADAHWRRPRQGADARLDGGAALAQGAAHGRTEGGGKADPEREGPHGRRAGLRRNRQDDDARARSIESVRESRGIDLHRPDYARARNACAPNHGSGWCGTALVETTGAVGAKLCPGPGRAALSFPIPSRRTTSPRSGVRSGATRCRPALR